MTWLFDRYRSFLFGIAFIQIGTAKQLYVISLKNFKSELPRALHRKYFLIFMERCQIRNRNSCGSGSNSLKVGGPWVRSIKGKVDFSLGDIRGLLGEVIEDVEKKKPKRKGWYDQLT